MVTIYSNDFERDDCFYAVRVRDSVSSNCAEVSESTNGYPEKMKTCLSDILQSVPFPVNVAVTDERVENQKLGVIFFILSGFFLCLNATFVKVLYGNYPEMTCFQILTYGSLIAVVIELVKTNWRVKEVLYDNVQGSDVPTLFVRVLQKAVSLLVNFAALKHFSLTTVAMTSNLSPMVTVCLGYFFLHERISMREFTTLLLAFAACLTMILGGTK